MFTLGDNAYFTGSREDYRTCYGPTWGRHRARTRPVPGNHDYLSAGAFPYFEYFGETAGPFGEGYYSFDIGPWHIIALNSNVDVGESSEQVRWLRDDPARQPRTLHVGVLAPSALLVGPEREHARHAHDLADPLRRRRRRGAGRTRPPLRTVRPAGRGCRPDPVRGLRSFVVGTGGAALSQHFRSQPNSEMRISAFGVLKLTLSVDRLEWDFIPVGGGRPDVGIAQCH